MTLDLELAARLHRQGKAARWGLALERFRDTLELSVARAFAARTPTPQELERYLASLHVEDLALACACAEGMDAAWEHFVREYRPALYRAADAIDPAGGARELADSLYGELFGLGERDGKRQSHFRYFHGRSSLTTWLRAVLSQRNVDRVRRAQRLVPLPDDESSHAIPTTVEVTDPRWVHYLQLMRRSVSHAVAALEARDRLRLGCYYWQDLTLAQIGRTLGEHEATVSRHIARARRHIREHVERELRERERMTEAQIAECFTAVVDNTGSLDIADILTGDEARKENPPDRSQYVRPALSNRPE